MGGDGNFGGGDGAVSGAERPIRPGGDPDLRKLKFDCQITWQINTIHCDQFADRSPW